MEIHNNGNKFWIVSKRNSSKVEKKALVAEVLANQCRVIMNNHVYTFGGKTYLQRGKGCIGDTGIGVIALLTMIWWSRKLKEKLNNVNIINELLKIFVDDVNGVFKPVKAGTEYINGELVYNEQKAERDKDIPEDEVTMEVVKEIANSIDSMIKMTIDIPSKNMNNKVPMLDVQAWIEQEENNKIFYQFFEKPTKTRFVISKDSAMPIKKKIETLSNEVFRRLHNTKHEISWEIKIEILEKFMKQLRASGYSEWDRYEILKSGVNRYEALRKKEMEGKRPFFRERNFQRNERDEEKAKKEIKLV